MHTLHRTSSSGKYRNLEFPFITLSASKSDSNMHRNFTLRKKNSEPRVPVIREPAIEESKDENAKEARPASTRSTSPKRSLSQRILRRGHSRSHSHTYGERKRDNTLTVPGQDGLPPLPQRTVSRRDKIVKVIANPDTLFERNPSSPPPESRFNPNPQNAILRTFFSPNIDLAPSHSLVYRPTVRSPPTPPSSVPSPLQSETPIFKQSLLSDRVLADLPPGYIMRSLNRGDFSRGFLEVLRVTGKVGYVSQVRWDERCELLRKRAETGDEYVLVVVDVERDRVVGVGRWSAERGFMNNLATNGRIEDIAVARDQKGKKMGLRILEALMHLSSEAGCHKTIVNCSEANEAFHQQCGFVKEGSMMVVHHGSSSGRRGENNITS